MKFQNTFIDGLILIEPDVYADNRGYFFEAYSDRKYREMGISQEFVQDNVSKSSYGTVRGLHYQVGDCAQGKLCEVYLGRILDVAVDLRIGSPTYGKHFSAELSDQNHMQFWIPQGFAHGFSVLSQTAIFHYKCTSYYSKKDERAIIFNDPSLGIDWHLNSYNLSEKDRANKKFAEIDQDFKYGLEN